MDVVTHEVLELMRADSRRNGDIIEGGIRELHLMSRFLLNYGLMAEYQRWAAEQPDSDGTPVADNRP